MHTGYLNFCHVNDTLATLSQNELRHYGELFLCRSDDMEVYCICLFLSWPGFTLAQAI